MKNSTIRWVLGILLATAGVYLVIDHGEHLAPYLPFTFLLGCLVMHLFMHGGHGGHGHNDDTSHDQSNHDKPKT